MYKKTLIRTVLLCWSGILLLGYNEDPPNGRTGAPFDGHCQNCHNTSNPNGYNGVVEILGLPDTIQPNTSYPLQIKITVTTGNPLKAGFQLVVVDKNNNNAGNLTANGTDSDTDFLSGREYLEHRAGKSLTGGPVSWNFEWTSPADAPCNEIKFYYIAVFANGNNSDFGDFPKAFNQTRYFNGGQPLSANAVTVSNVTCPGGNDGSATVHTSGGTPQYQYLWSNNASSASISQLPAGVYAVTVTDNESCTSVAQATVATQADTLAPQIECPPNLQACAADSIFYALPAVSDNCALDQEQPELINGLPAGAAFPVGLTQQVFQVTDDMGNTATCLFYIEVWPRPTIAIDTIIHDTGNAGTGSIALTVGAGAEPYQYVWEKDGEPFADQSEDISGLYAGVYTLEATDNNGCVTRSMPIVVDNTVGISNADAKPSEYRISPNPARAYLHIWHKNEPPARIRLVCANGALVRHWRVSGANPALLDLKLVPAGFYLLEIENNAGQLEVLVLIKAE